MRRKDDSVLISDDADELSRAWEGLVEGLQAAGRSMHQQIQGLSREERADG